VNEPCRKQTDLTIGGRKDGKMEKWNDGMMEKWKSGILET
jgi:hypothetical protein